MRRSFLMSLAALALLGAAPLAAQANACASKGPKLPAAGGWAEYKTDSGSMRMAYLGKDSLGERLELTMERPARGNRPAGAMVLQVAVPGFPYEMAEAKEVVMQMGDNPPMKMSEQMLGMMRSRMPSAPTISNDMCSRMTEVGKERITVAAGTFETTHWRDTQRGSDVWVSQSVPFGMVKAIAEGRTVELTGSGTGAKTKLTGTPQEMGPGMMGPPGGRPRGR
jgi:hypothetical protein